MILQWLNGDMVEFSTEPYPHPYPKHRCRQRAYLRKFAKQIRHMLASEIHVYPDQIRLIPRTSEDAFILVTTHRVVDLRGVWSVDFLQRQRYRHLSLNETQNESILDYFLKLDRHGALPRPYKEDLYYNPHAKVRAHMTTPHVGKRYKNMPVSPFREAETPSVDVDMENIENMVGKREFMQCSDDRVVDYLLRHPELIQFPAFLANRHPRAVEYCLAEAGKKCRLNDPSVVECMLSNTNPDLFCHFWYHHRDLFAENQFVQVLRYLMKTPNIDVVFERSREFV